MLSEKELCCLASAKSVAICSVLGEDSVLSDTFWPFGRGDLNFDLFACLANLVPWSLLLSSWEHVQLFGFCDAGGGGPDEERKVNWLQTD